MKKHFISIVCLMCVAMVVASVAKAQDSDMKKHEEQWGQLNAEVMKALQTGRYQEGIPLGEKAYQYALKNLGKTHEKTISSMNNLAALYYLQGRYAEAEPLLKQAFQLSETVLGKEPDTPLINNLAELYRLQGRYIEAEPLYKQALQLREKVLGKEHPDTLTSMNNLALLYKSQGRYIEAEPLYKQVLQLSENILGKEHPDTLRSVNNLAVLYYSQGRYGEAEPLYKEALQLREKVLGKEHPDTLSSINNLALLYESQGRYGEAEPLFKEALQLREKVLGKDHPDTLSSINNLALLYSQQGRNGEAEPLYKEALQLREKVLGKEHPDTLSSINNLALLYSQQGRNGEAEPLYKEALQLREKVLGKEHPDTLTSMNNLAGLYRQQRRNGEAEPLYKEALQVSEKVLGKDHPYYMGFLNNLAGLYLMQGRNGEAEPLFKEALQLCEKVLGKDHPYYIGSLNNLAGLYSKQRREGEAESLYKEALQLSEKVLGKDHPSTLSPVNNLAVLYSRQGRNGEAEPLFKEALQLREKVLGKDHPDTLTTQLSYIVLMIKIKKAVAAFRMLKNMENQIFARSFQELYTTSQERVRRVYLEKMSSFQDAAFSFALKYPESEYQRFAANVMLRWKQAYSEETAFQHRFLNVSNDPEVKQLKEKLAKLRADFSRIMFHPTPGKNLSAIWQDLITTETAVREKAKVFKTDLQISKADTDQVMSRLPKNSALIEFRMFSEVDYKKWGAGKLRWAAYLLLPDIDAEQQLFFEDLGEHADFAKTFSESKDNSAALYQLLFAKFDKHLKGVKTLFIAPDGFLHLVPFHSLRVPDGKFMAEKYQINYVQTGRDVLSAPVQKASNLLVAMGGVDFGAGSEPKADKKDFPEQLNLKAAKELDKPFKYLEHSKDEAEEIASRYEVNCKEGKAEFYEGKNATEAALKNLKTAPRILHLSTHGFYLQNPKDTQWSSEEPLLLSGLALANANLGLKGQTDDKGEDGLLYAIEVAGLNLQGTELVSLSACDTGKGVVDYSEGVYGLVRAFRTAGAQNVLMTLTPIGDRSSKEFFTKFYEIWLSSEDNPTPSEALHRTRLFFITHKNPENRKPEVWAPYVMVGK